MKKVKRIVFLAVSLDKEEATNAAICGPVSVTVVRIGTKTGRGIHWFQDISSGISTVRYSYGY